MQASTSQPRYPLAVQHVRRPSRPQSLLETLVEYREPESAMHNTAPHKARPTSLIMSSPAHGHMPRSIFPDVPASRRAAAFTISNAPTPIVRQPHPVSRRHTAYLAPAPMTVPPRREPRPLRSSPLAGPSLALSDDGTLTGSEESASMLRFRPNRISSTPDIIGSTLMQLEGRTAAAVASAPSSPTGRLSALPPDTPASEEKSPSPPSPAKKVSRRLSLGFKRLSVLPGLPKSESADKPDAGVVSPTATSPSKEPTTVPPPVPSIPVWARPSYMPPPVSPTKETPKPSREGTKSVGKRPSTAPSSGSAKSIHRRSAVYGSHESIPPASSTSTAAGAATAAPSTSRDPEVNWMSAAAAPRFSRLSLKADGVVLPLTAKEVRRRSTIRVPSSGTSNRNTSNTNDCETATLRSRKSQTSLRSLAASFRTVTDDSNARVPMPPSPPFRREASASSSSIASSSGSVASDSDVPETPSLSLSRASSDSGLSVDHDGPRTPGHVDELGLLSTRRGKHGGEDEMAANVELRVNDVTVEIIGLRERERRGPQKNKGRASSVELTVEVTEAPRQQQQHTEEEVKTKTKKPGVERKGTLKRVWKKLTGGVKA